MNTTTRIAAAALLLTLFQPISRAQEAESPAEPKASSIEKTERMPAKDDALTNAVHTVPIAEPEPEPAPAPVVVYEAADPYGFAGILNRIRMAAGLRPLSYDSNLSAWASQNNAAQSSRGLGHHILPNCFQNCCWNVGDAGSAANMWMNSPAHRDNMLNPSVSRFGIAYGPGPYWTLNAQ